METKVAKWNDIVKAREDDSAIEEAEEKLTPMKAFKDVMKVALPIAIVGGIVQGVRIGMSRR